MGAPSLARQVSLVLDFIDQIGMGKREARENGDRTGIHSIAYRKSVQTSMVEFAKWLQERYGCRSLRRAPTGSGDAWLNAKAAEGVAEATLRKYESHLLVLQRAIKARWHREVALVERKRRGYLDSKPRDRSYATVEVEALRAAIRDPEVRSAFDLAKTLGLRVREAAKLRLDHIDEDRNCLRFVTQPRGMPKVRGCAQGVTKGGRGRIVPISTEAWAVLRPLIQRASGLGRSDARLIHRDEPALEAALQRAIRATGIRSRAWHGLRHRWARMRLSEVAAEKYGANVHQFWHAYRLALDNRQSGRRPQNGMSQLEYRAMRAVVSVVLAELGHGSHRWDLIARYLSI